VREYVDEVFRAEHGCTRAEWVEQQARQGMGRNEAEKKSREIAKELLRTDRQLREVAAERFREVQRWLDSAQDR
jgi:hypothetical protein